MNQRTDTTRHRVPDHDADSILRFKQVDKSVIDAGGYRKVRSSHQVSIQARFEDLLTASATIKELIRACGNCDYDGMEAQVELRLGGVSPDALSELHAKTEYSWVIDGVNSVQETVWYEEVDPEVELTID